MHQPIPPITVKATRTQAESASDSAVSQKGVPPKVVFTLLIVFVIAYAGASLPIFHKAPARPAPVTLGKIQIDPDGDDPREELLYHWQDPKFSAEEQHQIAWMANGLALLGIFVVGKRIAKGKA